MKKFYYALLAMAACCPPYSAHGAEERTIQCGMVSFAVESVNLEKIEPGNYQYECRKFSAETLNNQGLTISLRFSGPHNEDPERLTFNRKRTTPPGDAPSFIKFDRVQKKYVFDERAFDFLIEGRNILSQRMADMLLKDSALETNSRFICRNTPTGNYVIFEQQYQGVDTKARWLDAFYMFFSPGHVAVTYWSPLLSLDSPSDNERHKRMVALFKSMKDVSRSGEPGPVIQYRGCD